MPGLLESVRLSPQALRPIQGLSCHRLRQAKSRAGQTKRDTTYYFFSYASSFRKHCDFDHSAGRKSSNNMGETTPGDLRSVIQIIYFQADTIKPGNITQ